MFSHLRVGSENSDDLCIDPEFAFALSLTASSPSFRLFMLFLPPNLQFLTVPGLIVRRWYLDGLVLFPSSRLPLQLDFPKSVLSSVTATPFYLLGICMLDLSHYAPCTSYPVFQL